MDRTADVIPDMNKLVEYSIYLWNGAYTVFYCGLELTKFIHIIQD